jgi:hypothetical protein
LHPRNFVMKLDTYRLGIIDLGLWERENLSLIVLHEHKCKREDKGSVFQKPRVN